MPELPEVETTRRGIAPHLTGRRIGSVQVRNPRMRWPVGSEVNKISGQTVRHVRRRAKYLMLACDTGTLILHLGMSGSLRVCPSGTDFRKHDHFVLKIDSGKELRLHDPRRFGAVLWHNAAGGDITQHPLLAHLGPEPLDDQFHGNYLWQSCRGRKTSVKQHIMNNKVVVGAGNIYACEALFRSGIRPSKPAGKLSKAKADTLAREIKTVLAEAIQQGGTTLRDFLREDGQPGYFKQRLHVYGRGGEPCHTCRTPIKRTTISNRSTFHCPKCQR